MAQEPIEPSPGWKCQECGKTTHDPPRKPIQYRKGEKKKVVCVECAKYWNILRNHGITKRQYVRQLSVQKNACAICSTRDCELWIDKRSIGGFALLCPRCRMAISAVRKGGPEWATTLVKMIDYLGGEE